MLECEQQLIYSIYIYIYSELWYQGEMCFTALELL